MTKTNTRLDRMYANLLVEFDALSQNATRLEFLQSLQTWLNATLRSWNPELRNLYRLDYYATLDLERFPVSEASLAVAEEMKRHRSLHPGSMHGLATWVGELFWEGITVESSITCPNCEYQQLRVMEDSATNEVVLACDFCDWAQSENGIPRPNTERTQPVTKEVYAQWRARNPGTPGVGSPLA